MSDDDIKYEYFNKHKELYTYIKKYRDETDGISTVDVIKYAEKYFTKEDEETVTDELMNPRDPLSSTHMLLENTNNWMICHEEGTCRGEFCTLHTRSDHSMRHLPQRFRFGRMIMERICAHGVGHPDPDEYRIRNGEDSGIHGCDGCCTI